MTIKEAQYFKKYIDKQLNDMLAVKTKQQLSTLASQRFAERFMTDITGQQSLPQSVFRQFLNEIDFGEAKQLHDDIVVANGNLEQALERADELSDIKNIHYTDVVGDKKPFYIYIDKDTPEVQDVDLWDGISNILGNQNVERVQIVELNIPHRGIESCIYLYINTSFEKTNESDTCEFLWTVEGYYSRVLHRGAVVQGWTWFDTNRMVLSAHQLAESGVAIAGEVRESLSTLQQTVSNHTQAIDNNTALIKDKTEDLAADIAKNTAVINKNTTAIAANTQAIADNKTAVDNELAAHKESINTLTDKTTENTTEITNLYGKIEQNGRAIAANEESIAANKREIISLKEATDDAIDELKAGINASKEGITASDTRIEANTQSIAANKTAITANSNTIAANTTKIDENTTAIANEVTARKNADLSLQTTINNISSQTTATCNDIYSILDKTPTLEILAIRKNAQGFVTLPLEFSTAISSLLLAYKGAMTADPNASLSAAKALAQYSGGYACPYINGTPYGVNSEDDLSKQYYIFLQPCLMRFYHAIETTNITETIVCTPTFEIVLSDDCKSLFSSMLNFTNAAYIRMTTDTVAMNRWVLASADNEVLTYLPFS